MSELMRHPLFLMAVGFALSQGVAFIALFWKLNTTVKLLDDRTGSAVDMLRDNDKHLRELISLMDRRVTRLEDRANG